MAASIDSDEEETFITIGTQLTCLDDDDPKNKPITLQNQAVKDAKGRPRFHGAFTGGFSAGYFNTVGSKEGWTPSAFVSSRSGKESEAVVQKPEDFMDDDDFSEHGIAPRQFKTASQFTSEERKRKRQDLAASMTLDTVFGGSKEFVDLIVPEILPIGIKLLRKMGWKEGQGIGPKKKKRHKIKTKDSESERLYGCALPPSDSDSELSDDELVKNFLFAPKDVVALSFEPKDNKHGLGYSGLNPRAALPSTHISLFDEPPAVRKHGEKGIRGQAFGVGAMEEEDDNIYGVDHMSNYDMTMEDEKESSYGWTAPGHHKSASQTPIHYIGKVLEGFTLSCKTLEQKKVFRPPSIPHHYKPVHKFPDETIHMEAEKQQKLNAVSRGVMLDEAPIMSSVFDLVPKEYQEKIEVTKMNIDASKAKHEAQEKVSEMGKKFMSPTELQKNYAAHSHQTFKPFIKDPIKQERYEKYLEQVKKGNKDAYEEVSDGHMTEWDRQREQEEFERAAKLYKPLAAALASRFTTGKSADDTDKVDVHADPMGEKDDQKKAVEMKMFGKLTRDVVEWHPDKCLCKRFNVPDPYPQSDIVGVLKVKKDKWSVFDFLNTPTQDTPDANVEQSPSLALPSTDQNQDDATSSKNPLKFSIKSEKLKSTSIFSHLDEENSGSKENKELQANRNRNKLKMASIFSHLMDDDEQPEINKTKVSLDNVKQHVAEERPKTQNEESTEKEAQDTMDLFRAIFKNTDSEDSSDSEEDESVMVGDGDQHNSELLSRAITVEDNNKSLTAVTSGEPDYLPGGSVLIESIEERLHQGTDSETESKPFGPANQNNTAAGFEIPSTASDFLPGGSVHFESIEQRLHQDNESNDELYGPSLPPQKKQRKVRDADYFDSLIHSRKVNKKKSKHKNKQKRKKDRLKEKLKKKNKKEKKKSKRKEKKKYRQKKQESSNDSSSEESSDSNSDSAISDTLPSDREILQRLKSLSGNRPRASDFM